MSFDLMGMIGGGGESSGGAAALGGAIGESFATAQDKAAALSQVREMLKQSGLAEDEINEAYAEIEAMYQPSIERGEQFSQEYAGMDFGSTPDDFQYDRSIQDFLNPAMEFEMGEAMAGIEGSAAAAGNLGSGSALQDLQDRGHDIARTGYGDAFNRRQADRSFDYSKYLNKASSARQNLLDRAGRAKDFMGVGMNSTQNVAGAREGASRGIQDLLLERGNVPTESSIRHSALGKQIRTFTDPEMTGAVMSDLGSYGGS